MTPFRGKEFDIPITRNVDPADLDWPSDADLESETLGGNRDFSPLGRLQWFEVSLAIDDELRIIGRLAESQDPTESYREWWEENEDSEDPDLYGFDLGTNALAAALAAAKCLPFYSCNAGAFDPGHDEEYPIVAFFCSAAAFPFVLAAAETAAVGLEHNHAGGLNVFARNVVALIEMAAALLDRAGKSTPCPRRYAPPAADAAPLSTDESRQQ